MKKFLPISLVIILFAGQLNAQEINYSQYYLNLAGVNPGFTGVEDYMDFKTGFRQGLNDFNTKNNHFYASAYGSLNKARRVLPVNNTLRISNPMLLKQMVTDKKNRRKHGIGGMFTSRNFGPYHLTTANANYAFHLPLTEKMNLSLGTRFIFGNEKINFTNFTVRDEVNDLFYQQLINANQGIRNYVSGDFGAVLYSNSFYLGISSSQLISKNISGDPLLNETTSTQWNIQTSGNIKMSADLSLNPALRITYSEQYNMQWATGARMRYKQLMYIGAGFNSEKKLSLLFGVSLNDRLAINYAYDKHLSELNDFNSSMHEFVLSISLFRRYGVETKFW